MKTLFFLAIGSGAVAYWRYTSIPSITIESVDWNTMKAKVIVRDKVISIDAATLFLTQSSLLAPISFSKYEMTAKRNQTNIGAPAVLRIAITEGDTIMGQAIYLDFDSRTITPPQSKK
ncbi:MAG: hypothetical protein M3R17_11535 [Bacteroidota bacterium]|nr:hypothetical protein [Bacteroidota bacterium]